MSDALVLLESVIRVKTLSSHCSTGILFFRCQSQQRSVSFVPKMDGVRRDVIKV